jgi:hypothetical protein
MSLLTGRCEGSGRAGRSKNKEGGVEKLHVELMRGQGEFVIIENVVQDRILYVESAAETDTHERSRGKEGCGISSTYVFRENEIS